MVNGRLESVISQPPIPSWAPEGYTAEKGAKAYRRVQKFITESWCHPLVDRYTAVLRAWFKENAARVLTEQSQNLPAKIALVPVGSIVWNLSPGLRTAGLITQEASDIDYILVEESDFEVLPQEVQHITEQDLWLHRVAFFYTYMSSQEDFSTAYIPYNLLFTPDELISGNLFIIRKLRVSIARYILANSHLLESNENFLQAIFKNFYSGWVNHSRGLNKRQKRALKIANRRFENDGVSQRFFQNVSAITAPNIMDFAYALIYTEGKIELDRQYAAQGILDEEGNDPDESENSAVMRHVEAVKANDHYRRRVGVK